jgi:hypothetical protein
MKRNITEMSGTIISVEKYIKEWEGIPDDEIIDPSKVSYLTFVSAWAAAKAVNGHCWITAETFYGNIDSISKGLVVPYPRTSLYMRNNLPTSREKFTIPSYRHKDIGQYVKTEVVDKLPRIYTPTEQAIGEASKIFETLIIAGEK